MDPIIIKNLMTKVSLSSATIDKSNKLLARYSKFTNSTPVFIYGGYDNLIGGMLEFKTRKQKLISLFLYKRKQVINSNIGNQSKLNMDMIKLNSSFNRELSKLSTDFYPISGDIEGEFRNKVIRHKFSLDSHILKHKRYLSELSKAENILRLNKVFDNIKYKRVIGMKIGINGRLTSRYRADRACKYASLEGPNLDVYTKGNLNSNFAKYRGFRFPNVIYSTSVGKIRAGSFGIKG